MTQLDSSVDVPVRLVQASGDAYDQLDSANSAVVDRVVADTRPTVIRGCPGSGRTSVALNIAKRLYEQADGDVLVVVPDRLRADLLQVAGERAIPGVVRPVRTPVSLAFDYTSRWFVERMNPLPAPQLKTGAREDSDLTRAIDDGLVQWPSELSEETLQMPEFRMEVRNLMARARESGWSGADLETIGRKIRRGMWISTGQLMEKWAEQAGNADSPDEPPLYDSAGLQELAAEIISTWNNRKIHEGVTSELNAPAAVVVDDLQDCTGATLALLEALHGVGTRIIATADPDVAVATYRGGEPHLDGRLIQKIDATVELLGPTHRGNQALRKVVQKVTEQVTVQDAAMRRTMGSYDASTDASGLSVKVYGSQAQENNAIARTILRYQLGYGPGTTGTVPLANQAVVVRSSADVNRIRFGLLRNGIPTTVRRRALTYSSDPVTSTMLQLLDGNSADIGSEHELLDRVLRSPLINARMTDIRRITDFYRAHVDPQKTPLINIVEDIVNEEDGTDKVRQKASEYGLDQTLTHLIKAFHLIKLGRKLRAESPQVALWQLWELADVTELWARRALRPGVDSEVFDERLDAVVSLFRTADVWEQRQPDVVAEKFAHALLEERLPTDTLAETGQRPNGVQVLTVAQAIGQDWDVVYIAGMQDGHWPNLTLRDRLSRAGEVTELANGNIELEALSHDGASARTMRKAALVEEYRLLAAAVSRARQALHISAVQSDDEAPSFVLNNLAKWAGTPLEDGIHIPVTQVEPGIDTRSLVARLRQALGKTKNEDLQEWYATLLAVLADEGIHLANPASWNGVGGLTPEAPETNEPVTLSPSQIEMLVQCPARWFLTRHGGDKPWNEKAAIGTLVHEIAEELPEADLDEMLERLDELWDDELFPRDTALGKREYESIVEKVEKLANYLVSWRGKNVLIEHPVFQKVNVGGETFNIAGRLDRIEQTPDGVVITDIKTGSVPTKEDTVAHLQLAAYQFALNAQNVAINKARLLALSQGKPENWIQPNLFTEGEFSITRNKKINIGETRQELEKQIATAARIARGSIFPPITGSHCSHCPVKQMCPVMDEGLRTLE